MLPRVVACYFAPSGAETRKSHWTRMAAVLEYSVIVNSPAVGVTVKRIPEPVGLPRRSEAVVANTHKLQYWTDAVLAAQDGEQLVLMDVDTFVLRDLSAAFYIAPGFDLAYTVRDAEPRPALPFNAGVIFVRASERSRLFMRAWADENMRMAKSPDYHARWFRKYGGINQSALGKLLEDGVPANLGMVVATLPCSEWNCEDCTWDKFDPAVTRVVHVKSALRRDVFSLGPAEPRVRPLTRLWRELERGAVEAGRLAE